jgi:hypothetical protein
MEHERSANGNIKAGSEDEKEWPWVALKLQAGELGRDQLPR